MSVLILQFLQKVRPVFTAEETELGKLDFSEKNRDSKVIPGMFTKIMILIGLL